VTVSAPRRPTLLVDTNIVLDVVLERAPWVADATALFDVVARGQTPAFIAGHTVTTVHYIVERERDRRTATTAIGDLLTLFPVVPLDTADFQRALALRLRDYEDAVQAVACLRIGADFLVTRNPKDYRGSPVTPRAPGEVLALISSTDAG
jgi:predicted nucleic acid-binding protein